MMARLSKPKQIKTNPVIGHLKQLSSVKKGTKEYDSVLHKTIDIAFDNLLIDPTILDIFTFRQVNIILFNERFKSLLEIIHEKQDIDEIYVQLENLDDYKNIIALEMISEFIQTRKNYVEKKSLH